MHIGKVSDSEKFFWIDANERTYVSGFYDTPDGRIQRLRFGNGRWESAKLNERMQVTEFALGASNGDGSLWKVNYAYGELNTDGSVNAAKNTGNIAKQTISFAAWKRQDLSRASDGII